MLFNNALTSIAALLFATQAIAAPAVEAPAGETAVQIATSPYYACNAPNNEHHHQGSSCRYYSGPSDQSDIVHGECEWVGGVLNCVGT